MRRHALARPLALAALVSGLLGPSAAAATPLPTQTPEWRAPVWPVRITRPFDNPAENWLPGHRGVDLRTLPGTTVRAAGDGRVVFATRLAGRGVVVVDHGMLRTTYEPVEASVVRGERVRRGDAIGVVATGTGHCGAGTCLHLGLRRGEVYLDPRLVLGSATAVLRPW